MPISRRRFLKFLAVGAASTTLGYILVRHSRPTLKRQLTDPGLPEDTLTGLLDTQTLQVLMATTEALINIRIETTHYENFFRWRSENVRGYKTLYEQFALTVRTIAGCNFAECDIATRRRILERAFQVRNLTSRWDTVRTGILERDWLRFDKYIVHEIFALFVRTDAWIVLGYESWPGTPRGLATYRQAPNKPKRQQLS